MDNFDHLVTILRAGLAKALVWGDGKLYTTDAKGETVATDLQGQGYSAMAQTYLLGFRDLNVRQYHNCSCCKDFLNRYGTLAVMKDGTVASALFSFLETSVDTADVWMEFARSLADMCDRVLHAKITGVFVSSDLNLGVAQAGGWKHFSLTNPVPYAGRKLTPGQRRAELREEHRMLRAALPNYSQDTFDKAVSLLNTETMYRSEKFLGLAKKLQAIKSTSASALPALRSNLIWQAVAQGDPAVAHFNSGVISTLLDDLQAGLDVASVKKKFDAKTGALVYKRATAAPKAGQVKAAENLVAKLGLAPAFERRYATVDEVSGTSLWKSRGMPSGEVQHQPNLPQVAKPVFGHLLAQPKAATPLHAGGKVVTWAKFSQIMLTADAIEFHAQDGLPYGAITQAVNPDAPKLFKHGSTLSTVAWTAADAAQFNLVAGKLVSVDMIVPSPVDKDACLFVIPYTWDKQREKSGLGLYPELISGDLQEARATIMAHSSKGVLPEGQVTGDKDSLVAGVVVSKRLTLGMTFRVTKGGAAVDYTVDRWD